MAGAKCYSCIQSQNNLISLGPKTSVMCRYEKDFSQNVTDTTQYARY